MKTKQSSGFTLIELMIAVVIISILAAIALPSYTESVRKSRRADAYGALLDCAAAQARRYTTTQSYFNQAGVYSAGLCGATDTTNVLESSKGHYRLQITNASCLVNNRFWCFTITATAQGSQANDTECASFVIDHTGRRTASPDTGGQCWRS